MMAVFGGLLRAHAAAGLCALGFAGRQPHAGGLAGVGCVVGTARMMSCKPGWLGWSLRSGRSTNR
jgi:hypothetical protein